MSLTFHVLVGAELCCLHIKLPLCSCSEDQKKKNIQARQERVQSKETDFRLTQAVGRLKSRSQPELCKSGLALWPVSNPQQELAGSGFLPCLCELLPCLAPWATMEKRLLFLAWTNPFGNVFRHLEELFGSIPFQSVGSLRYSPTCSCQALIGTVSF